MINNSDKNAFVLEAARTNFLAFCTLIFKDFQIADHHKKIAAILERVADPSDPLKKVLISLPPRHTKSLLVNELFVPWYFGKFPDAEILTASNAASLSKKFGRKIRNTMQSEKYKTIFPQTVVAADSRSAVEFDTTAAGTFFATSVSAQGTGRNAKSLIIIDDPVKDLKEILSKTYQQTLWDWYTSVIKTREEDNTAIVVVHTRWHDEDLIGQILQKDQDDWTVISMPAIDEDGMALWPEKFSIEKLMQKKATLGSILFSAVYQQQPIQSFANMIQLDWFKSYKSLPDAPDFIMQSYDTASKDAAHNDKTAVSTWYVYGSELYLVDVFTDRLKYPDLKKLVYKHAEKFHPDVILIEDKSSGTALIQDLKVAIDFPHAIIPIMPCKDKITRMSTASPLIESGNVHIPASAPWLVDFQIDISQFPFKGRDTGDSVSQALNYFKDRSRKVGKGLGKLVFPDFSKSSYKTV